MTTESSSKSKPAEAIFGRTVAFRTFKESLNELRRAEHVSEQRFRDTWLQKMKSEPNLYASGWYAPPPDGVSVLFASPPDFQRVSFNTLRDEVSWPSAREINWQTDILFAYCSVVDRSDGRMGDFALTLYFGDDRRIREHFNRCYLATHEVIAAAAPDMTANELFELSQQVFSDSGLKNEVVSSTDSVPLDLGHTLTALKSPPEHSDGNDLPEDAREELRTSRQFVSTAHSWQLEDGVPFTVEPQLRSVSEPELPQITFHYALNGSELAVLAECDELFRELKLIQ